jgi:hypothetical protein
MILLPEDRIFTRFIDDKEAKALLSALFSRDDEELPEMEADTLAIYEHLKEKSERISNKQSDNGSKGGAPKGNSNAKKTTKNNPKQPNSSGNNPKQPSVTVTDTVTVTDIEAATPPSAPEEKKQPKRFVKPTAEEIDQYCQEKSYNVNAKDFIGHYDANGWKVGRTAMVDWKAALGNWHRHNGQFNSKGKAPPANNYTYHTQTPNPASIAGTGGKNEDAPF